jgi:alpha/beta superfamily hydrolase
MLREISGPVGRLEALLDEPDASWKASSLHAAVVLAHPLTTHGGTMHTKAVYQAAKALTRIGCAVLRFNFRGAGSSAGVFDDGRGEMDDFRAAMDFVAGRYAASPIWAGGMSFGSWIAMTAGAADERVAALIGIATAANHYDFDAVAKSTKAKFFIHGERDEICPLKDVKTLYARSAEPKELVVIDAADHLFDGKVGEVADAVEDLLGDWAS